MAEVLSQSQIDALLNAVRSGEKDLNEPAEEQQEKIPDSEEMPAVTDVPISEGIPEGNPEESIYVVITADSVNLRSEPNTQSDILTRLQKGDRLTLVEETLADDDKWYCVVYADGLG